MKITFREAQEIMEMVNAKLDSMNSDRQWGMKWAEEHNEAYSEDADTTTKRKTLEGIKAKFDNMEI